MEAVHIIIYDEDGRFRTAFEFDPNRWADQLNDNEEDSPIVHEILEALENGRTVRVRPGEFHPERQRVRCPNCDLPVCMPRDWDGKDETEALCNACNEVLEDFILEKEESVP